MNKSYQIKSLDFNMLVIRGLEIDCHFLIAASEILSVFYCIMKPLTDILEYVGPYTSADIFSHSEIF